MDILAQRSIPHPSELLHRFVSSAQGIVHGILFQLSLSPFAPPDIYLNQYVQGSIHYRNPKLPIYMLDGVSTIIHRETANVNVGNESWTVSISPRDNQVHVASTAE